MGAYTAPIMRTMAETSGTRAERAGAVGALARRERARFERARQARDARFDGTFFLGVTTTGIYCRPVCPSAPAPRPENVRYFPSAAAAAAAGFRPCKRCRPEASAGTPAWLGSSAVVSRALRLIDDGVLDDGGSVRELACKLGLGERQLRRLFAVHLGASPAAVARNRRVHFARRLLEETDLRIVDVAFASGFGSLRAFNEAFRRTYGQTPRELRAGAEEQPERTDNGFSFRLAYRPPYDWRSLLEYLSARVLPGVETVAGGVYRRLIPWAGGAAVISVRPEPSCSAVRLVLRPVGDATAGRASAEGEGAGSTAPRLLDLVNRVRRMFDLGADPRQIRQTLGEDPVVGPLVARDPGVRLPVAWDPFELTVRAVLGQQVSVAAATTLTGRLIERFGEPVTVCGSGDVRFQFPRPEVLVAAELEEIGLPGRRAQTVRDLAAAVAAGEPLWESGGEVAAVVERLRALPGIGPWTAHYVALRGLGLPDAFPAGDLGLRRALAEGGRLPSERDVERIAERWRPWRGYAAILLWRSGVGG